MTDLERLAMELKQRTEWQDVPVQLMDTDSFSLYTARSTIARSPYLPFVDNFMLPSHIVSCRNPKFF